MKSQRAICRNGDSLGYDIGHLTTLSNRNNAALLVIDMQTGAMTHEHECHAVVQTSEPQ